VVRAHVCAEGVGAEHARFQRNLQASAVGRVKLYQVGGRVAVLGSTVLSMHNLSTTLMYPTHPGQSALRRARRLLRAQHCAAPGGRQEGPQAESLRQCCRSAAAPSKAPMHTMQGPHAYYSIPPAGNRPHDPARRVRRPWVEAIQEWLSSFI
jgi:hypothetical protein